MSVAPTSFKKIVVKRKLVKPQTKRDKLPITNYEHDFIKRLEKEKILVVEAATGSGKSTQLPQYVAKSDLFQAERRKVVTEVKYSTGKSPLGLISQGKMVVSTQPNAFAAAAVATRVGFEYDNDVLGRKVGLITPTENKFDPAQCEILFVSDSELVRIMTQDALLSRVGVLIIDEAHERTLYTDVIMTLAKEIREQRDDFYIVISSATIEVKRFLSFMFNLEDGGMMGNALANVASVTNQLGFRPTPLTVQGKTYEVAVHYDPIDVRDPTQEKDPYLSQILTPKIVYVLRNYLKPDVKGHGLIFVEDTHTVLRCVHHLRRYLRLQTKMALEKGLDPKTTKHILNSENTRVIPLYLSMPLKEQQKIMDFVRSFQNRDKENNIRYVFIADNVAETSITLPDVKLVIDTGRMMVSSFDMMRRLMVTEETFVSKDRASQRQGRTGRTGPGTCVRLYNDHDLKLERVEPDIKRVALDKVALQLAAMNINPKALRLIEPPDEHKFIFAIEQLIHYECLVTNAQRDYSAHLEITEKGKVFVQLPFAPDTCEQLWQASLISAEATSIMHSISCLFNNESSNIFEHSAGLTWKALAEQVIDERPFFITPQVGIRNNLLASQHWSPVDEIAVKNDKSPLIIAYNKQFTAKSALKQPSHLIYNPFWQSNKDLQFAFNLNSGSDLELGYIMYLLLMHYQKPSCAQCLKRDGTSTIEILNEDDHGNPKTAEELEQEELHAAIIANKNKQDIPDELGFDNDGEGESTDQAASNEGNGTNFKRVELCPECEQHFRDVYHVLPQAIKQAENFIRSTRDLVHRSLARNYTKDDEKEKAPSSTDFKMPQSPTTPGAQTDTNGGVMAILYGKPKPHPKDFTLSKIITHCIYTALSHMAGVVLVTNHLSEGVVLPHKYFKMVKATIDQNACSNTVDTYYKLVTIPSNKKYKAAYTCVKQFIVVHVTARQAHDYNITCLHPFDLEDLNDAARNAFSSNLTQLQLQKVAFYPNVGRGLYSSIDYVLSNQRIDNMARQYELERSHLRQQQLRSQGGMGSQSAQQKDDEETRRNMESMNWSRFAAIPITQGTMNLWTLLRYQQETSTKMADIIASASRHMEHLFNRERRSYRLPLSNSMYVDICLSHNFTIRELIIHANGFTLAVRPEELEQQRAAPKSRPHGTAPAAVFKNTIGKSLGTKSQQISQVGLANSNPTAPAESTNEFDTDAKFAVVATNVLDMDAHWAQQGGQFDDDAYAAALNADDEDDDIEMLDDDMLLIPGQLNKQASSTTLQQNNSGVLEPPALTQTPSLLQQRSISILPSGTGISQTFSQSTNRVQNEVDFSQKYDALQSTRFPTSKWRTHTADVEYENTLTMRRRIEFDQTKMLLNLTLVHKMQNGIHTPQNDVEEELTRTISPLLDLYKGIHHSFESIIHSLKGLHKYQYFPLIPEFADYDQIVKIIYDQSTALISFTNDTHISSGLADILAQHSEANGSEFFVASLLDIQSCFIAILRYIGQQIARVSPTDNNPQALFAELKTLLSFKFTVFGQFHFQLGPPELTSWIQLAPHVTSLFDNSPAGFRRFIAPGERTVLCEPKLPNGTELLSGGTLVDLADLRLTQVSEGDIRRLCCSTFKLEDFEVLYTLTATIHHAEIVDVDHILADIDHAVRSKYGKDFHCEVMERINIIDEEKINSNLNAPYTYTRITFSGNQTCVSESARNIRKIGEPHQIPLGPLTNSTNALLHFITAADEGHIANDTYRKLVTKHSLAADYVKHGSDGTLNVWGDAKGVHEMELEIQKLVEQFEERRRAFQLPHNIFADLKNDNENSPYYSAFQLLTQQIDRITNNTAIYELKTDETSFILLCKKPEQLTQCLQPLRGFKSKCGIEDDDTLAQTECMICLKAGVFVQKLSACDHAICGACLSAHACGLISDVREQKLQEELKQQERLEEKQASDLVAISEGEFDILPDDTPEVAEEKKRKRMEADRRLAGEMYASQIDDSTRLTNELKQSFTITCPSKHAMMQSDYYSNLAAGLGIKRSRQATPEESKCGTGCAYNILPADIMRICTPSQIHQMLFLLAKPVMKATNSYLPCPSASCTTLLPLESRYQHCPRCNIGYCTACNTANNSLHSLLPCHIFKAVLSYHDEVQHAFADDLKEMLQLFTKSSKSIDLSAMSSGSAAKGLLQQYFAGEMNLRVQMGSLLLSHAQKWLDDDWVKHHNHNRDLVRDPPQIYLNPGLFTQCGSFIRFFRGIREKYSKVPKYHQLLSKVKNASVEYDTKTQYALLNELISSGALRYCYHGTPLAQNVKPIMHDGLSPAFRRGQAYGEGEYASMSPAVSYDYGSQFFLITAFLDHPDTYKTVEGYCYVIKNPVDFKSSYCFPLGVVRVSNHGNDCQVADYDVPHISHGNVRASCAAWLGHLRLDASGTLSRAIVQEEKLQNQIGVACKKDHVIVKLADHHNPRIKNSQQLEWVLPKSLTIVNAVKK